MRNATSFRAFVLPPLLLAAGFALSGCGQGENISRVFGLTRDAPDEFTVTTQAPLSMPPDFSLRPPEPGAPRPQAVSAPQAAEAALAPGTALAGADTAALTPGQQALIQEAGPPAPTGIRREVDAQAAQDAPGQSFTDKLMFWRSTPPAGVVVDPAKEAQRLRQDAALGQNVTAGDTPIIQPRKGGLFDGLF
jgi:hypothetical protein